MLHQKEKEDIFQASTNYNHTTHTLNHTHNSHNNQQYKSIILTNRHYILNYVTKIFHELRSHIVRAEIAKINTFYTPRPIDSHPILNLAMLIQNIIDFYRKQAKNQPIDHTLIQQLQSILEDIQISLQAPKEDLLSDSDSVKNIQRTSHIVKKTVQRFIECIETRDVNLTDYLKYGQILRCLINQLTDIITSPSVIEKLCEYDPYSLPAKKETNPMAETIKSPKSLHSAQSENSIKQTEPHYHPRQKIHFDRLIEPKALDFIYPSHHRVYICEAAKAYSDIVPSKINKINVDRYPKYTDFSNLFEITSDDYFSGEQTIPIIYHLIPGTNKISFYRLSEIQNLLSLTHEYENVKDMPFDHAFSKDVLSCISPFGSIFITNSSTTETKYDLDFWQFKFSQYSIKKRVSIPTPRKKHGMIFLNNYVFLIGGINPNAKALKTVDKYNVKKKQWSSAGALHVGVVNPTVCAFKNRYILSCCGLNEFDFISNRMQIYDTLYDGWTIVKTTTSHQFKNLELLNGGSAVAINSDVIYIFGGKRHTNFQHDTDSALLISEITEVKKKPSRISAELVPTGSDKRVILSSAGSFKPNSGVIHKNSIYFLRDNIF